MRRRSRKSPGKTHGRDVEAWGARAEEQGGREELHHYCRHCGFYGSSRKGAVAGARTLASSAAIANTVSAS